MRLTQIKLSGFKSFVDPTAIATPGQLVGVVGPNGCGKSNVIDAVRWVLGESKASALRGESMQDVIFNGAGERKPVGRAAVELIFDNSLGRVAGQWASYSELSIKRVLQRDGDSIYSINNQVVRRRDITDLFLGTGLGPRAYAIIEQGMISRVIEAKPEELRIYLEEAAGVSKYKERRRETEHRLSDTHANLARVEDIRAELAQQLEKLAGQAQVATEYRRLEHDLQTAQKLLWFAKQQEAARARERHTAELARLTTAQEALQASLRETESKIEQMRAEHYQAGDHLHQVQGDFYAANAEVTRLEQQLQFQRDSQDRINQQVNQVQEQIVQLQQQLNELKQAEQAQHTQLTQTLQQVEQSGSEEQQAKLVLRESEAAMQAAQQRLELNQQHNAQIEQRLEVIAANKSHSEKNVQRTAAQRDRLSIEENELRLKTSGQIVVVHEQWDQERQELVLRQEELQRREEQLSVLSQAFAQAQERSQEASKALTELAAKNQALIALQTKVEQGADNSEWLAQRGYKTATHLWQQLSVEPGWEDALEAVLRERLNAIAIERLDEVLQWRDLPRKFTVYATPSQHEQATQLEGLLHKISFNNPALRPLLSQWLSGIYCADDLTQALARRNELSADSVQVTRAGHLVDRFSISFFAPDVELHGVLARQRELAELAQLLATHRADAEQAEAQFAQADAELKRAQAERQAQAAAAMSQERRCHDLELELIQLKQAEQAAQNRLEQIAEEMQELAALDNHEREQQQQLDQQRSELWRERQTAQAELESAQQLRNQNEAELIHRRERLRQAERSSQEIQFTERSIRERLHEIARQSEALQRHIEQQQSLAVQLTDQNANIDWDAVENSLQQQLHLRETREEQLASARNRLEELTTNLRSTEETRLTTEQQLEPVRTKIEDVKLKEQAARMTEAQFAEQLQAAGADLVGLPEQLQAWGKAATLPGEIERLQKAIVDLGAVNLAALEELNAAEERKHYLDSQAADLNEAITTLENAIRRIDRETRAMLQETFTKVNEEFGALFPTLFGGGQARLVMTGEEILDAGVQVIAQPPGKRNSSIHLLSGGEKALTAIALVFALFKLNPAPFCLLDEVDAPLDDTNTERFCALVKQMAEGRDITPTQFIYISHNKISMEMANQLVGVTMNEPGVSHVVAVDIAEALQMTDTARQPQQPAMA